MLESNAFLTRSKQTLSIVALALLWLALRVPHLTARFSFNWDSSLYARGMAEFNVLKNQPHPPGFPLWVFSARGLEPLLGGAMRAQIFLALLMAMFALTVFYFLARQVLADNHAAGLCTLLLAYSPGVALNSSIPATSIVDMASSAVAGYLAFLDPSRRQWRIVACLTGLGVLAGFRQSGVGLLVPFIAVALLFHLRDAWRAVTLGALLGLIAFMAWYIPLAESVGGFRAFSHLVNAYFLRVSGTTSVFLGGALRRHVGMIGENLMDYSLNLIGAFIACGLFFRERWKVPPGWFLYVLWIAPSLIMILAIHSGRVGQCMQLFPPLLLLCAAISKPRLPAAIAGILLSLAISYFPYGQFQFTRFWRVNYLVYRGTPRMALDLEASQRTLDQVLRELQHSGAPQPFVCAREFSDAPNIASVQYDFSYVSWVLPDAAPKGKSIWLLNQTGPDAETRKRYQTWRRISGDNLVSLWEATPSPQPQTPSP
jgi:hypothetical protein